MQGVRIRANFYATGHWRCRIHVSHPGDDPALESDCSSRTPQGERTTFWATAVVNGRMRRSPTNWPNVPRDVPDALRPDPEYVSWFQQMRYETGADGVFALWDDYDDWESEGRVAVIRAFGDARGGSDFVPLPPPP